MELSVQNISPASLKPGPIIQQSPFWAKVKDHLGWNAHAFQTQIISNEGEHPQKPATGDPVSDDLLLLTKPVDTDLEMGYVPYGPLFEPSGENQGKFLEELSENLREDLSGNCSFIRYDLHWRSPWSDAADRLSTKFELPSPGAREVRMNFDTHNHALRKSPTNVLPSNTVFLDLGRPEEDILSGMRPKTRYNIRLSIRKGVRVREVGAGELGSWYQLHRETADRNHIHLDEMNYFRWVLDAGRSVPGLNVKLLIAEIDGKPLAGMFLAISGGRATYLYGASSNRSRNLMGSYALQWAAIKMAKQAGCHEYDMFGVSPGNDPDHPMYGLYRFKTGFGGELFFRQGCWDYVFDEEGYESYRARELVAQGFHS